MAAGWLSTGYVLDDAALTDVPLRRMTRGTPVGVFIDLKQGPVELSGRAGPFVYDRGIYVVTGAVSGRTVTVGKIE